MPSAIHVVVIEDDTSIQRFLRTALEAAGMVWRVATFKGHARYDGNIDTHSHFLCETCGKIDDVAGDAAGSIGVLSGMPGTVRRVEVMISGECAACTAARASASQQA